MKRVTTWLLSITVALVAAGGAPIGISVRWINPSSISRSLEIRAIHNSKLSNRVPTYPRRARVVGVWHDPQFEKSELTKVLYQRPPPPVLL